MSITYIPCGTDSDGNLTMVATCSYNSVTDGFSSSGAYGCNAISTNNTNDVLLLSPGGCNNLSDAFPSSRTQCDICCMAGYPPPSQCSCKYGTLGCVTGPSGAWEGRGRFLSGGG